MGEILRVIQNTHKEDFKLEGIKWERW